MSWEGHLQNKMGNSVTFSPLPSQTLSSQITCFLFQVDLLSKRLALSHVLVGWLFVVPLSFREEQEKLNVWVALLNLENMYGTEEALMKVFERAIQYNEPLKVFQQLADIYSGSEKYTVRLGLQCCREKDHFCSLSLAGKLLVHSVLGKSPPWLIHLDPALPSTLWIYHAVDFSSILDKHQADSLHASFSSKQYHHIVSCSNLLTA